MGNRTIKEYEELGIPDTYEEKAKIKEEKELKREASVNGIDNLALEV